jgi:hypothetical protein
MPRFFQFAASVFSDLLKPSWSDFVTPVQHIMRFAVRVLAVIVIVMLIASATRKLLGWG